MVVAAQGGGAVREVSLREGLHPDGRLKITGVAWLTTG
jgi:hypothetical protein